MSPITRSWMLLGVAIVCELFGTTFIKLSNGFTEPVFVVGVAISYLASFSLFSFALKHLPLGLSYGVWGGIGTVGTAVIGSLVFGEPVTALMGLGIALIIAGVAFMNAGTEVDAQA